MTTWHLKHERHGTTPWAVQSEALRRANGRDRYGYWLEQGLGKTSLALNEFVGRDDVNCLVIICPQSFKQDWALAPEEWGIGFIQTLVWPFDDRYAYNDETPPFLLCVFNYEAVRWSQRGERGFAALELLLTTRRCMLVIDESKAIGNPSSGTTKGILRLVKHARVVRELNGTPITESVMDYWGQLRALGEFDGWNPVNFKNRFAVRGGYFNRQILRGEAGINPDHAAELAAIIDGCTFRALKKDWRKDLPPQVNQTVHLEMTDNQKRHYQTMMEEFYAEVAEDENITAELVLTQLDKLRQISSCLLLDGGKVHLLETPEKNPKIKATLEIVSSGMGKAIVVHYYKQSGDALFEAFGKEGFNPARIGGGQSPEEVRREKDRFNDDPTCRVLVGQEVATARGHTLLGSTGNDRCNRIIFYENHFGLYWREQMKDRNHRGEQDQTCWLIDLVCSPIDQIVVDGLIQKKGAADMMDRIVETVRNNRRMK